MTAKQSEHGESDGKSESDAGAVPAESTMETAPGLPKDVSDYLWLMAESVVTIPVGGKVGRWTREDRVILVWSALCSIARNERNKKK